MRKPTKPKMPKKPKASASNQTIKNYLKKVEEKEKAYKKALSDYEREKKERVTLKKKLAAK